MRNNASHSAAATITLLCLGMTLPAESAPDVSTFRISQLASSQDGYYQIVELEEMAGSDGQDRFAGLTLTVTNRFGITRTLELASDLPNAQTAHKHVAIASRGTDVDFVLPEEFLPTDGGTIDFAGIDRWSFDAIPTDGGVLTRSGKVGQSAIRTFAGESFKCCGPFDTPSRDLDLTNVDIIEFYDAGLDHYFISGSEPDIVALESGRISGWQAVDGLYLPATSAPVGYGKRDQDGRYPIQSVPVCRYYIPPGSHFFSASVDECNATGQQHPEFVLETSAAFYTVLPDPVTGDCPKGIGFAGYSLGFLPVYRLWNHREDTNHRFTTSIQVRGQMIAMGWTPEGYGPMGVVMCAPDYE